MERDPVVRITGRWRGPDTGSKATLTLPWSLRRRSRFRASLDDGREAGVWMPRGEVLRDGDRLQGEQGLCVLVRAATEPVAVGRPKSSADMARACFHLGNRHTSLQIDAGSIRFQPDHVLEAMLRSLGVPVRRECRPFDPEPGAYSKGSHSHSYSHSHSHSHSHPDPDARRGPGRAPSLPERAVAATPGTEGDRRLLSLLRLVSPALPVGAFTGSDGLEYAVDAGWVADEAGARRWIGGRLRDAIARVDVPLLRRFHDAWRMGSERHLARWSDFLRASREADELWRHDQALGRALARLLHGEGSRAAKSWMEHPGTSFPGSFALAAFEWGIPLRDAAQGYAFAWCENQVAAAVKLIPLGQTAGQNVLRSVIRDIPEAVSVGLTLEDDAIGASEPGLAIASALHETQHARLFRS